MFFFLLLAINSTLEIWEGGFFLVKYNLHYLDLLWVKIILSFPVTELNNFLNQFYTKVFKN